MAENVVLCGANSYVEKYYFNEEFSKLPEQVKEELQKELWQHIELQI